VQPKAALSGATFPGGFHEDVRALVEILLEATERRGYRCVVGWCWGYAPRMIRGSTTAWSNHAWALAVDINAPKNPMSSRLITDMPSWMPRMWEDCGFRWGGRYRVRPDAMHYEYVGRPGDVAGHLARARGYLAALGSVRPPPARPAPEPEEYEMPNDVVEVGQDLYLISYTVMRRFRVAPERRDHFRALARSTANRQFTGPWTWDRVRLADFRPDTPADT
jgi:hypothetical protein